MEPAGQQRIPRPETWKPGRKAGWEEESFNRPASLDLATVLQGLGAMGHLGPAPQDPVAYARDLDPVLDTLVPREATRRSAVLCVLFEEQGKARVLLTRRSGHLRTHKGEVAFPGGRLDEGEVELSAALREANEEVDLDLGLVDVVGWLTPVVTLASGSFITPIVATTKGRPHTKASPDEVERVFDVALDELLRPGVFREERWSRGDRPAPRSTDGSYPIFFFETAGETIWGATARMLYELCHLSVGLSADIS
jgi:8-oxo-dGTP pyrophosphatase MutT (NUDIX family)